MPASCGIAARTPPNTGIIVSRREEKGMSQITVRRVFVKAASGAPMIEPINQTINVEAGHGIAGDKNAHPFSPRQVLIVRREDLEAFRIPPGELRENIILEGCAEGDFQPGALLTLGDAVKIRLTFHCEPCKRIGHVVSHLKSILGHRGELDSFQTHIFWNCLQSEAGHDRAI